ncbi:hypothetical protein GF362_06160 [Candidatus Dojkabacteria bacterium]|nr:hypothetical protein [Candidatus Dojkabacteria bacterium]
MKFELLLEKIYEFEAKSGLPPFSFWPPQISFSRSIWKSAKNMKRKTSKKGWEYSANIVDVHGDLIFTDMQSGNTKNVKSNQRFKLKYKQLNDDLLEKQIYLNDKIFQKKKMKISRFDKEKPPYIKPVLNIHTHPEQEISNGSKVYSFFSPTDLNTFLYSNSVMFGLITEIFWLVGKTDKTISRIGPNGIKTLERINQSVHKDKSYLESVIIDEMKDWGLVFYKGRLNSTLKRVL